MSGNFAPYQDVSPDITRTLSPPPTKSPSPRPKAKPQPNLTPRAVSPPASPSYQNNTDFFNPGNGWPSAATDDNYAERGEADRATRGGLWGTRSGVDLYETSLGIRLDWEACLAYLAFPPAGPVVLLIFEHRSDYVRYGFRGCQILVCHVCFEYSSVMGEHH